MQIRDLVLVMLMGSFIGIAATAWQGPKTPDAALELVHAGPQADKKLLELCSEEQSQATLEALVQSLELRLQHYNQNSVEYDEQSHAEADLQLRILNCAAKLIDSNSEEVQPTLLQIVLADIFANLEQGGWFDDPSFYLGNTLWLEIEPYEAIVKTGLPAQVKQRPWIRLMEGSSPPEDRESFRISVRQAGGVLKAEVTLLRYTGGSLTKARYDFYDLTIYRVLGDRISKVIGL